MEKHCTTNNAIIELMNNAIYGKIMENLENRIDAKFASIKTDYFKMEIKTMIDREYSPDN